MAAPLVIPKARNNPNDITSTRRFDIVTSPCFSDSCHRKSLDKLRPTDPLSGGGSLGINEKPALYDDNLLFERIVHRLYSS